MTQSQLDCAVAGATGESVSTVHRLGFGLLAPDPYYLEPEDLCLVLDCPFCGHPVAYPGGNPGGEQALAECVPCDVYFDFTIDEVYAADVNGCERVMNLVA